jgi:hypothetical protein
MQTSVATAVLDTGLPQNITNKPPSEPQISPEVQAWQVTFRRVGERGAGKPRLIKQPAPTHAWTEQVDAAATLDAESARSQDSGLTIVFVPTHASSTAFEERMQNWVSGGAGADKQVIRATIRTVRVAWTPARVVIHAPLDQFDDAFDAVLRFSVVKRDVDRLEEQLPEMWADLDTDVPLSHSLRLFDLMTQKRVNQRTERVTRMNSSMLRLQSSLEQLDVTLANASTRMFDELADQGDLFERLEMLEDPIEFGMDHYELVNTRLLEARNGYIEILLEVGIVALLVFGIVMQFNGHPIIK